MVITRKRTSVNLSSLTKATRRATQRWNPGTRRTTRVIPNDLDLARPIVVRTYKKSLLHVVLRIAVIVVTDYEGLRWVYIHHSLALFREVRESPPNRNCSRIQVHCLFRVREQMWVGDSRMLVVGRGSRSAVKQIRVSQERP